MLHLAFLPSLGTSRPFWQADFGANHIIARRYRVRLPNVFFFVPDIQPNSYDNGG